MSDIDTIDVVEGQRWHWRGASGNVNNTWEILGPGDDNRRFRALLVNGESGRQIGEVSQVVLFRADGQLRTGWSLESNESESTMETNDVATAQVGDHWRYINGNNDSTWELLSQVNRHPNRWNAKLIAGESWGTNVGSSDVIDFTYSISSGWTRIKRATSVSSNNRPSAYDYETNPPKVGDKWRWADGNRWQEYEVHSVSKGSSSYIANGILTGKSSTNNILSNVGEFTSFSFTRGNGNRWSLLGTVDSRSADKLGEILLTDEFIAEVTRANQAKHEEIRELIANRQGDQRVTDLVDPNWLIKNTIEVTIKKIAATESN